MSFLDKLIIDKEKNIKETMKVIDRNGLGIVLIIDDSRKICGIVTDGDIRRSILQGKRLFVKVIQIANLSPLFLWLDDVENRGLTRVINSKDFLAKMVENGINLDLMGKIIVPIINKNKEIEDAVLIHKDKGKLGYAKLMQMKTIQQAIQKVLVIGGAGYLGSVLTRELLKKGYSVKVLDNLTYGDEGIKTLYKNKNFDFKKGDMNSIQDVVNAIKDCDAVIHLGAIVGDPASSIDPQRTLELNYHSAKMIADICKYHQINRFIFASTCSVYGKGITQNQNKSLSEQSDLSPVSLYAETKIEVEKAILNEIDENFSPTIFRMATLYGYSPRMRFDLVVNILTAKGFFDKKIPIFGGEQYRPLVHVKDAARAYIKCLEEPIEKIKGEIFNLGANELNYRILELGEKIKQVMPNVSIQREKNNKDERSYCINFNKINKILNYETKYSIEDGIKELLREFKKGEFKDYTNKKYNNYKYLIGEDHKAG